MKIAQLTPGSGDNFYCENCLRDAALVRAIRDQGHDVTMIPMYLPLQTDKDRKTSNAPIFFGGINVYLQQKSGFFRRTPRWLDKLFDSPKLLSWVSRRAGAVDAKDLGETTVSMLKGQEGKQVKELERLGQWLAQEENRPDVICLSNLLLAGMVKRLKEAVRAPVVCLLQDEDEFLDELAEQYKEQAWQLLKECAKGIDKFISVSEYFAGHISERADIPREKIEVIYTGIEVDRCPSKEKLPDRPTIGYLSRMCETKGLEILIDAFVKLKKQKALSEVELKIAGGHTAEDKSYLERINSKLRKAGVEKSVQWVDAMRPSAKLDLLKNVSVVCVPEVREPAYGLYVLESLAAGTVVVQPAIGVFRELCEQVGEAVILYEPNGPEVLADKLSFVLRDEEQLKRLGGAGREAIIEKFDIKQSAVNYIRVFEETVSNFNR